ncbi:hypothetical protein BDQ12DRAFT_39073 [Crucibulum laeve]|uniref:BRCT domain-containing protein n=1 Tax=Crucibulum laeve TaxID=68775 RepID=A0A5C3MLR0_9AGAR|nr:hypothetical protein BDQ12DRAFT_39073 [Crucibulum laeve]
MPEPTIFPEKRTRSQVTLPDEILRVADRSPFKDARIALRNYAAASDQPSTSSTAADDTDDELLLSPRKDPERKPRSKRSASPPSIDEYSARAGTPPEGRELKRVKRDVYFTATGESIIDRTNAATNHATPAHTRNNSEPIVRLHKHSTRKRANTSSKKPSSSSSNSPPTVYSPAVPPGKGRAQSVPLFPSTYLIPHIDLNNPPPSPHRSRSRSPSKEREPKLRITSGPIRAMEVLASISDETVAEMDVDTVELAAVVEKSISSPAGSVSEAHDLSSSVQPMDDDTPVERPPSSSTVSEDDAPLESPAISHPEPPSTPVVESRAVINLSSPLTPLPETPHPSKALTSDAATRYIETSGWGTDLKSEKEAETSSEPVQHEPVSTLRTSRSQSRLPRPSMAAHAATPKNPLPTDIMGPPLIPTTKAFTNPSVASSKVPLALAGKKSTVKTPSNAFEMMMNKARSTNAQDSLKDATTKIKGKNKAKPEPEESKPKATLKAKMRPREKQKPKPKPIPVPVAAEETQDGLETQSDRDGSGDQNDRGGFAGPPSSRLDVFGREQDDKVPVKLPSLKAGTFSDKLDIVKSINPPSPHVDVFGEKQDNTDHRKSPSHQVDVFGDAEASPEARNPPSPSPASAPSTLRGTSPAPTMSSHSRLETLVQADLSMQDLTEHVLIEAKRRELVLEPDMEASPALGALQETETILPEELVSTAQPSIPPIEPTVGSATIEDAPAQEEEELPHVPSSQEVECEPVPPAPILASARTATSKLPLGKRRVPASVPVPARMTRSASSRQKEKQVEASTSQIKPQKPVISFVPVPPAKRTASGSMKNAPPADTELSTSTLSDLPTDPFQGPALLPGSPMKISLPIRDRSKAGESSKSFSKPTATSIVKTALTKTPSKSMISMNLASPSSPGKLTRSMSMFSERPTTSLTRASSVDLYHTHAGGSGSSLSTLSSALEKLRMPPPARPNTSMGFNRDSDDDSEPSFDVKQRAKDDAGVRRAALGMGKPEGLKRASTIGPADSGVGSSKAPAPDPSITGRPSLVNGKSLVQRSLATFMAGKPSTQRLQAGTGAIARSTKQDASGNKPRIFGVGTGATALRRPMNKVSRNPNLPSVMASPVKGADGTDNVLDDTMDSSEVQPTNTSMDLSEGTSDLDAIVAGSTGEEGKEKKRDAWKSNASRRASMASQALSQSLSSLPIPILSGKGQMGPPATPPRIGMRSSSSSYPLSTSTSPGKVAPGAARTSARITKTAPGALGKVKAAVASVKKGEETTQNPMADALNILKDCVIFVDVRTDDGDEAGSLFTEMLEGVGAKILTRVGQTCTHIVFKNGLMSTVTRYRLLRDPKPLVVGIAWVVECVEQRKRVDESKFLVDIEDINIAGINKRRRSMLPKLISREPADISLDMKRDDGDGDRSMDGSSSSMILEDDLPPLEKARRRKSMLVGPRP